jgi:hypothetical protein
MYTLNLVAVDLADALSASGATPTDQGYHVRLDVTTPDTSRLLGT